jgi:hypothetical protein
LIGERVPGRNLGAFAGWSGGNGWVLNRTIQHCCAGNSTRALYYVWEHILENSGDELKVNLLLNRASPWADLYSYVPYSGRVELKMKATRRSFLLHAPEWVKSGDDGIVCTVSGATRPVRWKERYLDTGPVNIGETVAVTFPISERTVKERIGPEKYTLILKGNTVISIDPSGKNIPLYTDRERYRTSPVEWVKVQRFVPDEAVVW